MTTLPRKQGDLVPNINARTVQLPVCQCQGVAVWDHSTNTHTQGRRGPPGGRCGACGGAIPDANGQ